MEDLLKNLNYEAYLKSSIAFLRAQKSREIQTLIDVSDTTASKLYTANYFSRGPLAYYLISSNIAHLNKLSANLYEYYLNNKKDITVIPFNAANDAYSKMEMVLIDYLTKSLERFMDDKEIISYRKEAEKEPLFGLKKVTNYQLYLDHAISLINEKKIKVLFIINNGQLIEDLHFTFKYNRRETFVRFIITTSDASIPEGDEAELIYFDNKNNDVFKRDDYLEKEIDLSLSKLDTWKLKETYKKYDPSYFDVLLNAINNLAYKGGNEKKIKRIITNKDKMKNALDFFNLLVSTIDNKELLYIVIPFIFASPYGISKKRMMEILKGYRHEEESDYIEEFFSSIYSVIYRDEDERYHVIDSLFIKEIKQFFSYDMFHASYIAINQIYQFHDDVKEATNYLYYASSSNIANGLKSFINHYKKDPYLIVFSINDLLISKEIDGLNYLRNYIHLLDLDELKYLFYQIVRIIISSDMENELFFMLLDRIRECIEDNVLEHLLDEEDLEILVDLYEYLGDIAGYIGNEKDKIMYHFHAYIYRNEYNRLYNKESFDKDFEEGADLALTYTQNIKDDKIDKKERYPLQDDYEIYDLQLCKHLDAHNWELAKSTLLNMLHSYSINLKDHALDIIEFYQGFNFELYINSSLLFYYLYLLIKDKNIDNPKLQQFITSNHLRLFKA